MKALRYHGNHDIRLDEIDVPKLRPGWVKIKTAWAGICGSGHEFAGTIVEVDSSVTRHLKAGQRCTVFPALGDRTCHWCQRDVSGMCPSWGFLGYSGFGGGFAEYICVDARDVHLIPDNMSLEVAALVEPLSVGWHAVKLGKMKGGDSALVLGAGPIGIAVILALRAQGISNILVSEISVLRSEQARYAGASHVLNPREDDVPARCRELTDGLGPHFVLECAGVQASMDTAIQAVRGVGVIVNVGIFEKDVTINPNIINRRSLTYVGSNVYTRAEFDEVIAAISDGRIKQPERMITARISLEDSIEKGFTPLLTEREKHCKILINPSSNESNPLS